MKERILHISKFIVGLSLVASILTPTLVKFSHAFNHHKHEVCEGDYNTHFHALDLDCEYFKFKLNNQYYSFFQLDENVENSFEVEFNTSQYFFLKTLQESNCYLRGPPVLS